MNTLEELCKGAIYGQAVGDALGLGTEFLSKSKVSEYYPQGLNSYNQIVRDPHRRRWVKGDWTDDTDQMLCILDSLIFNQEINIIDIAGRIYMWADNGGMGIGRLILSTLCTKDFLINPHAAAKTTWEKSGRNAAPNGGIMRTSILGVWKHYDLNSVKQNAENVCKITHYDPRCVGSCVAVCVAISLMIQGVSDFEEILQQTLALSSGYDEQVTDYLKLANTGVLADFDLDEGLNPGEENRIGYTLKAMGASFWVLKNAHFFQEGILQIIHEGGDADTNGAVAGALLGAKFGFSNIPSEWVNDLYAKQELDTKIAEFFEIMKSVEKNV